MKRFHSVKKNHEFREAYKTGKSYANRLLVMYVCSSGGRFSRIGISASKKVGNSVVRHHITRLLREVFRLHEQEIAKGLNIIVVARAAAKEADYHQMESAFMHLCGLHHIILQDGPDRI